MTASRLWLRQIALVAVERDPVVDDLRTVFGLEVCHNDPAVAQFGLHNAVLPIGTQFLEVVAPIEDGTTAGRYLDRRGGDGGYMVITQCDDHTARRARVQQLGVRVVGDFRIDGYTGMQLHPRDTGGSFLEIDHQHGDDPSGAWGPAGADWQRASRSDVVSSINAAEIQCDDPANTCRRWAHIVEIEPQQRDGTWTIPLSDATLRFVEIADGRGEGLGGVDITVVDADRLRSAADARGCLQSPHLVVIGGLRFNLGD